MNTDTGVMNYVWLHLGEHWRGSNDKLDLRHYQAIKEEDGVRKAFLGEVIAWAKVLKKHDKCGMYVSVRAWTYFGGAGVMVCRCESGTGIVHEAGALLKRALNVMVRSWTWFIGNGKPMFLKRYLQQGQTIGCGESVTSPRRLYRMTREERQG